MSGPRGAKVGIMLLPCGEQRHNNRLSTASLYTLINSVDTHGSDPLITGINPLKRWNIFV